jgi:hypothetical protein
MLEANKRKMQEGRQAAQLARRLAGELHTQAPGRPVKKMGWWHKFIVDWELANPGASHGELARLLKISEPWLSQIYNSDMFKDYQAERLKEHQVLVSESVIDKVEHLGALSLDVMQERIEAERKDIGLGVVKDAAELCLKAMGFGARAGTAAPGTETNIYIGVDSATLDKSRGLMRNAQTIDGEVEEISEQKRLPSTA